MGLGNHQVRLEIAPDVKLPHCIITGYYRKEVGARSAQSAAGCY